MLLFEKISPSNFSKKKKIWPIKALLSPHMLSGKIHSFLGYNNKEEVVLKTNEVNK
jgi:hypothetical protein